MIVEVPDEVALLLREYMLLEEAYRILTYRYKAFYSLDRDEGIEREILQKPLNPAEIWEQRQMTAVSYTHLLLNRYLLSYRGTFMYLKDIIPVSYTHLDVYKRQWNICARTGRGKRHQPRHWRKDTINISCVFLIRKK